MQHQFRYADFPLLIERTGWSSIGSSCRNGCLNSRNALFSSSDTPRGTVYRQERKLADFGEFCVSPAANHQCNPVTDFAFKVAR